MATGGLTIEHDLAGTMLEKRGNVARFKD